MTTLRHNYGGAKRGFSIIEMLVYIAVLVSVTLAGVLTYLSLSTNLVRYETERAMSHAAQVSLERMVRDIREATSIDLGLSTLGTSPGVLTLVSGATTTKFSLSSGNVLLSRNGVDIGPLTNDNVTVSQLLFTRYSGTATELIRIALTLSASNKAASTTQTFYSSAVLRGTYE
jgi:type II secretory pathway pseudopilin PulG